MKTSIFSTSILIFLSITCFSQMQRRVLFIGNSYTAGNSLPSMVSQCAQSAGHELIFESNTPGGQTLQNHSTNSETLSLIQNGDWDYVVLQEQSQVPSIPEQFVQQMMYPSAAYLDSLINEYNPCAETVFFMTWGRKNGDYMNCPNWPPVCTYEGMDSLLFLRYMYVTETNNAIVSPVGQVWKYLRANHPEIELYLSDESHPSLAGSYVAACTFFTILYREDPISITWNSDLSLYEAQIIREACKTIVYDNLSSWFVGFYDPIASFEYTIEDNLILCDNTSINAETYSWHLNGAHFSDEIDLQIPISSNNTYEISLIASKCELESSYNVSIDVSNTSSIPHNSNNYIQIFPTPVHDILKVLTCEKEDFYIIALDGRKVEHTSSLKDCLIEIDVSQLESGIYILVSPKGSNKFVKH